MNIESYEELNKFIQDTYRKLARDRDGNPIQLGIIYHYYVLDAYNIPSIKSIYLDDSCVFEEEKLYQNLDCIYYRQLSTNIYKVRQEVKFLLLLEMESVNIRISKIKKELEKY